MSEAKSNLPAGWLKIDGFLAVAARSGDAWSVTWPSDRGSAISPAPNERRPAGRLVWLAVVAIVVLAGVAVPYGLLAGRDSGLAVISFWLLFGLVVIGLIGFGVLRWRDEP